MSAAPACLVQVPIPDVLSGAEVSKAITSGGHCSVLIMLAQHLMRLMPRASLVGDCESGQRFPKPLTRHTTLLRPLLSDNKAKDGWVKKRVLLIGPGSEL